MDINPQKRLGLVAGNGQFPVLFVQAAKKSGFEVFAVAHEEETLREIEAHAAQTSWIYVGELLKMLAFFREKNITQAAIVGGIDKTRALANARPDELALSLLTELTHTQDDNLLRALAQVLEKDGIEVLPSHFLLPELVAQKGVLTQRVPTDQEQSDLELAFNLAQKIGALDIGQCVVTAMGSVLAVEAIDGTDATIARGGILSPGGAVVAKAAKPIQDERFDLPSVGAATIESMQKAGITALAVEAGRTLMFDRDKMLEEADRAGISIVGF